MRPHDAAVSLQGVFRVTKHRDLHDDLAEEFEPSALPIGRDGAPVLEPLRKDKKPYPRLCEAGPCVHYHRMETQFDAAAPIAERVEEGGKLVGISTGAPFHTKVHHYCYPDVGIETDLGSMPVVTCNRWRPIGNEYRQVEMDRAAWRGSADGQAYQAELDAWKADQAKPEPDEQIDPLSLFVTMHVTDECEVDVLRGTDPTSGGSYEPLVTMSARGARDTLETPYLRSEFGPGTYSICVMKPGDAAILGEQPIRELVAQTQVEVIS